MPNFENKTCEACGHGTFYRTANGMRVCTSCGMMQGAPAKTLAGRVAKLEECGPRYALVSTTDHLFQRLTALEKRMDDQIDRDLEKMVKRMKGERYDAWMGGVLKMMPSDALARELARRLENDG